MSGIKKVKKFILEKSSIRHNLTISSLAKLVPVLICAI